MFEEMSEAAWRGFREGCALGLAAWCAIMMLAVIAGLLVPVGKACAQERYSDPDKLYHLGAGLVIGAGVTAYTRSATAGALAGCAAGVAKELYDASQPQRHNATEKDAIATCLGAAIGAGGAWAIVPGSTVRLQWRRQF